MRTSKRRASPEVQTSTNRRTSRSMTSVNRKMFEEKENILRRAKFDNLKALEESGNLSRGFREEDYFESGTYRADRIGKPWRSPNLSRRGIHAYYQGSENTYSETGEVASSISYNRGEPSSRRLYEGDLQETETDVNQLQVNSETSNNSNSKTDMRPRSMRISDDNEFGESTANYNFMNTVSHNSNNSAAYKRGARQITLWKTSGERSDISESKVRRLQRSATKRISSIFGLDKEDDESEDNGRITRSRARKMAANPGMKSDFTHTTGKPSVTSFRRIYNWIHTSIFRRKNYAGTYSMDSSSLRPSNRPGFLMSSIMILTSIFVTIFHKFFYTPERVRVLTGAPAWPLVPCYAVVTLIRWFSSAILRVFSSVFFRGGDTGQLFSREESTRSKSAAMISEAARPKRSFLCCPSFICCLLLLLPFLLLTTSVIKENTNITSESAIFKHSNSTINWISYSLSSIYRLFAAFLISIRDCFLLLISERNDSLPLNPPLDGKSGGIDQTYYESLVKSVRDHSARLVAQEKELKAQKVTLERLVSSHMSSEQTTTNFATKISQWEDDLKSVRNQLSSLDAALAELKKLKLSVKKTKVSVADSAVDSQTFELLSKQVQTIAAEQEKQKGFDEELNKFRVLIRKLEGYVKEQKEWTTEKLNKHEVEYKKLITSFAALSSKTVERSGNSAQVADSSAALNALGDKVMTDHKHLAALESQQLKLQTLFTDLEKRLKAKSEATQMKDSSASTPQTEKSFTNIASKLQSLETVQNTLSERLDDMQTKQQQRVTKSAVINVGDGCKDGGKDCASTAVVQEMIDRALAIFAADRIARPDFALESAGGSVIGTRCTKTYTDRPAVFSLFGIPLFRMSRSPRTVIQPALYPGECWALSGTKGQLVIRLASDIEVSGVTVEHVPKSLSPNGRIDSAPHRFVIKGLASETDYTGVKLGEFEYLDNNQPLQTFDLPPPHKMFRYVELQILTNHGHTEYTCVYRVRIHGKIVGKTESNSKIR